MKYVEVVILIFTVLAFILALDIMTAVADIASGLAASKGFPIPVNARDIATLAVIGLIIGIGIYIFFRAIPDIVTGGE